MFDTGDRGLPALCPAGEQQREESGTHSGGWVTATSLSSQGHTQGLGHSLEALKMTVHQSIQVRQTYSPFPEPVEEGHANL